MNKIARDIQAYAVRQALAEADKKHESESDHDRIIRLAKEVAYRDVAAWISERDKRSRWTS